MGGTLGDFQSITGSSTCLNWDLLVADFMGSEHYQCEYEVCALFNCIYALS